MGDNCEHPKAERELAPHGASMIFEYRCTNCGACLFVRPYSWLEDKFGRDTVDLERPVRET